MAADPVTAGLDTATAILTTAGKLQDEKNTPAMIAAAVAAAEQKAKDDATAAVEAEDLDLVRRMLAG